jgi:Acetyltransferase (GNAT) family
LAQHLLKYPGEAASISDTAAALGGKTRLPSLQSFIPVGHISLDAESENVDQADASKGLYCITTFYISRAIQNGGLGRAAMDTIESEAINEPLCAKVLSLDTVANESTKRKEMWAELGQTPPSVCVPSLMMGEES